ncbi:MAG: hypothetical protein AAFN70_00815, partial [Planctomycetota bacterium]
MGKRNRSAPNLSHLSILVSSFAYLRANINPAMLPPLTQVAKIASLIQASAGCIAIRDIAVSPVNVLRIV